MQRSSNDKASLMHGLLADLKYIANFNIGQTGLGDHPRIQQLGIDLGLIAGELVEMPLTELPERTLASLASKVKTYASGHKEFVAVARAPDRMQRRDEARTIGDAIFQTGDEMYKEALLVCSFMGLRAAEFASVRRRVADTSEGLSSTKSTWDQRLQEQLSTLGQLQQETLSLVETLKEAASEHGVARFAASFHKLADGHSKAARRWVWGALVCGSLAITAALIMYAVSDAKGSLADIENAYLFTTRIVVVGLLVVAAGWCAGMFRVRAHLEEMNRHRATALDTFKEFVTSTHGRDERDAVLKAVVRTIFAPSLTGLVNSKDERSNIEFQSVIQSLVPRS